MGQYFKLVNPDQNEFVSLPGGMKAIERVTSAVSMGMIGYLMLEGPIDGTCFSRCIDRGSELGREAINERREIEKEHEEEKLEQYLEPEERPSYIEKGFERNHDIPIEEADEETVEEYCRQRAWSTYRKENLNWDEDTLFRVGIASYDIDEALDYAGRWAGDNFRLIGDYADNDLYSACREDWIYEYENEEFVNYATTSAPIVPASIERDDIVHSTEQGDPSPGDLCHVAHPDLDEKVYAHYVGVADSEWTNITDGLQREFVEFVGEDWIENHDSGLFRPDMMLSA